MKVVSYSVCACIVKGYVSDCQVLDDLYKVYICLVLL